MLKEFFGYFSYDMVWFALIVGILIALCSALFGVILVLKRFSFIGDGLSHVAFGATAIATVLSVTDSVMIVMPITVAAAILLLKTGKSSKLKGDAAVAVISVGALALGYLIMSIAPGSSNVAGDVCSALFASASILYLDTADVILCAVMSAAVIAVFVLLYNKIFAVTFDEDFARAVGVRTSLYNILIAVVTAVIIVMAMKLVGSLLISALIIFPALSAMRIMKSFRGVVIFSCILSVVCTLLGFFAALLFDLPIGPAIVAADIVAFCGCMLVGKLVRRS
ncbi:MAG: metal ABC transporter permease [Clostridia bacterium]|nr:metal ABC transporter permease [Clostridia bacterium]